MEKAAKDFLKAQLEAGLRYDDVRRALISNGYRTEGFEEAYFELANELGIKEQKPQAPDHAWNPVYQNDQLNTFSNNEKAETKTIALIKFSLTLMKYSMAAILTFYVVLVTGLSVLGLVPLEASFYENESFHKIVSLLAYTLEGLLYGFVSLALIYFYTHRSEQKNQFTTLAWTWSKIGGLIWLLLVTFVLSTTSFLLLIVPGIAFAVYSLFTFYAFAYEGQVGFAALMRSVDLVKGNFWKLAGKMVVVTVVSLLFFLPMLIVNPLLESMSLGSGLNNFMTIIARTFFEILAMAFSLGSFLYLYEECYKQKNLFDKSSYIPLSRSLKVLFVLGILVLFFLYTSGYLSELGLF